MMKLPESCRAQTLFLALAAIAPSGVAHAAATEYPSRPVRLVVPFAAGGGADTLSRIIAPKLGDAMGQTWVVDNRGGAAGNLAAEIVANAAPSPWPTNTKGPGSPARSSSACRCWGTAEGENPVSPSSLQPRPARS